MAPTAPFPSTATNGVNINGGVNALFPALYLYPLNDTWAPKHIALTNQHTKIGRQTSSKTAPGERNGFFDSKVLSRQHAEVWEENGKIYIKDVKSSNGTFINGERLSSEGHESEPFELKSDDIVEFGIDIVGEDNKTIIHHKVAARVVCVFSEQDAQVAARAEQHQAQHLQQHQYLQQQQSGQGPSSGAGPSGVNGIGGLTGGLGGTGGQNFPPFAAQRRAQLAQQGLGSMGGMRPPGKTGLSFDVILSRLQGEVQKSRETGAELSSLTNAMTEIHDTLGGSVPANLPPFPTHLPPVRPPQESQPPAPAANGASANASASSGSPEQPTSGAAATISASAVVDLQSQIRDTQSSLASHLDKVRALEGVLAEQEVMKREVTNLREMMEERRRETETIKKQETEHPHAHGRESDHEDETDDDDDDDARSIASTVLGHELERVDEEDEEQLAEEERREERESAVGDGGDEHDMHIVDDNHAEGLTQAIGKADVDPDEQRREDLDVGRPHTPEPTLGLRGDMDTYRSRRSPLTIAHHTSTSTSSSPPPPPAPSEDVYEQVQKLTQQVTSIMAVTTSLEAQHTSAQSTISVLEGKVASLEAMLRAAEEALAAQSLQSQGVQTQAQPVMQIPLPVPMPSSEEVEVKIETEVVSERSEDASPGLVEVLRKVESEEEVQEEDEDEGGLEPVSEVETALPSELQPESESVKAPISEPEPTKESLTAFLAQWKSTVEGQWGNVQSEWTAERERLAKAREEWEAARSREKEVDFAGLMERLERVERLQSVLVGQQEVVKALLDQQAKGQSQPGVNGDAVPKTGTGLHGLVTPPSPRSQSSDSGGRYRRRRRRSSASNGNGNGNARGRSRGSSGSRGDDDADTDATLAEDDKVEYEDDGKHGIAKALGVVMGTAASIAVPAEAAAAGAQVGLATPALTSSVGSLDSGSSSSGSGSSFSVGSGFASSPLKSQLGPTRSVNTEGKISKDSKEGQTENQTDTTSSMTSSAPPSPSLSTSSPMKDAPNINVQTAVGVVLLGVAAAAVFWKVRPE